FAVVDVEGLVAARGRDGGPRAGAREQIRIHRLEDALRTAGVVERLAGLLEQRAVDADGRNWIHMAAERLAEDHLRAQDRPVPALPLLLRPEVVLLQPVEVLVRMARRALARGHRHRLDVRAVGLGALEQRDVLETPRRALQRLEQI